MAFDFGPCIRPVHHIKGPAPAIERKAGVRGDPAAGHGIEHQVALL